MLIDALTGEKVTGERFSPSCRDARGLAVNLRRHATAIPYLEGKRVLELGCGTGISTYLYQCAAEHVTAVDYSREALDYGERFPCVPGRVTRILRDVAKDGIPDGRYDIAVAVEFLEHLERPQSVLEGLRKLKVGELFFSVPLDSLAMCPEWHKYCIRGLKDVTDLIDPYCRVDQYLVQDKCWILGHGKMRL